MVYNLNNTKDRKMKILKRKITKNCLSIALMFVLSACGGGGDETSATQTDIIAATPAVLSQETDEVSTTVKPSRISIFQKTEADVYQQQLNKGTLKLSFQIKPGSNCVNQKVSHYPPELAVGNFNSSKYDLDLIDVGSLPFSVGLVVMVNCDGGFWDSLNLEIDPKLFRTGSIPSISL